MIHYSCDRCKLPIDSEDFRFIVKIEIQATIQNGPQPIEDDRDHLVEIEEMLEKMERRNDPDVSDELYQRRTFDLCPTCYQKFARNPLSQEAKPQFGYSPN